MRPSDDIVAAEPEQRRQRRRRRRPATTLTNGQRAAVEAAQSSPSLSLCLLPTGRVADSPLSLSAHSCVCECVLVFLLRVLRCFSSASVWCLCRSGLASRFSPLLLQHINYTAQHMRRSAMEQAEDEPAPVLPELKQYQIILKKARRSCRYYKKTSQIWRVNILIGNTHVLP